MDIMNAKTMIVAIFSAHTTLGTIGLFLIAQDLSRNWTLWQGEKISTRLWISIFVELILLILSGIFLVWYFFFLFEKPIEIDTRLVIAGSVSSLLTYGHYQRLAEKRLIILFQSFNQ